MSLGGSVKIRRIKNAKAIAARRRESARRRREFARKARAKGNGH